MKFVKLEYLYIGLLFLISIIFLSDIFFHSGLPSTFDTTVHITNIAQFYLALKDGDFPVVWLGGLANYGLPMGIISHQMTSYLGAFLTFFTHDPVTSFYIVVFIGILLANIFTYSFLRVYVAPEIAFVSTFLFNFSAYRIINFYIRGAIPEIFSNLFLPLILTGMYLVIKKGKKIGILLLIISFFGLALNHPMMLLIYGFVYIPYLIFLLFFDEDKISKINFKEKTAQLTVIGVSAILGVCLAGYYLLPLILEIKYFYYGNMDSHLTPNSYLSLKNFFDTRWYYFTPTEISTRGHVINFGILNTLGILLGLGYLVYSLIRKSRPQLLFFLGFCITDVILIIFMTTKFSDFLYQHIAPLNDIQFPWRMLSALIFLPPFIYAILFKNLKRQIFLLFFVCVICLFSFSQLYGKNYRTIDKSQYFFSTQNVYSLMMNTIWTDKAENYPVKKVKPAIIGGKGSIKSSEIHNSSRLYHVSAQTPIQMIDYTFYFPGWKAYIDGTPTPIEFQDPNHKGVITYYVPSGDHTILLEFTNTKARMLGNVLSATAFALSLLFISGIYLLKNFQLLTKSFYQKI